MQQLRSKCLLLTVIFLAAACVPQTPPPGTVTAIPTATETTVPTATPLPTSTPRPKNTPAPTSTPGPIAVVVDSMPPGNRKPIRITDRVGQDFGGLKLPERLWFERIVWVRDVQVEYPGGRVLLSGTADGRKPLFVDDVLTIKVTHEDGSSDTFEHFFRQYDAKGPIAEGPFDLTEFFDTGLNMLYVTIYDNGYSAWGTQGLWLVIIR